MKYTTNTNIRILFIKNISQKKIDRELRYYFRINGNGINKN